MDRDRDVDFRVSVLPTLFGEKVVLRLLDKSGLQLDMTHLGFEESVVRKILRLVNINEFNRYQTAPVLRVSSKSFGVGRRMPIVGKYLS